MKSLAKPVLLEENTRRTSEIFFCENAFEALKERLTRYTGAFLFTDSNVYRLYGRAVSDLRLPLYVMPAGEMHKGAETLFALLKEMAAAGLHRSSCLVALGGGVVGDVGGLAASLYMRGIACIQVPTTLLSQVDSSVGGKTAIDFEGTKNLVGSFYSPDCVLVDGTFLETLPARELRCGLGEIVKHGALSSTLFDFLESHERELDSLDFLKSVVPENIAFKASVVREDAHEKGARKCLNLGHTTGHAMELYYGDRSHGEFVLEGILYEAELARRLTQTDGAYLDSLTALCRAALGQTPHSAAEAARFARLDKKNTTSDTVQLVAPVEKGQYRILELEFERYETYLREIGEKLC